MRRFLFALYGITFASQAFSLVLVAPASAAALGARGWHGALVALALSACVTALMRGRIALAFDDHPVSLARSALERLYFTVWCAGLATIPPVAVAWIIAALGLARPAPTLAIAYAIGVGIAAWSTWWRPLRLHTKVIEVEVEALPAAFDGYRIVQLSDLHVGALWPPALLARLVDRVNALDADAVALTGDYVTSGTRFHEVTAAGLARLRARDGVFAVLGNHDNFGGCEPLRSKLLEGGVILLQNASRTIERAGAALTVVGVDDVFTRRANVERSFEGVDTARASLVLAHDPKQFHAIARKGPCLVLSGHTHWGQVGVPFVAQRYNIATRFFRFSAGLYREGAAAIYVHPGVGATGVPVRFGVPPEVTVLVLRQAEMAPSARNRS